MCLAFVCSTSVLGRVSIQQHNICMLVLFIPNFTLCKHEEVSSWHPEQLDEEKLGMVSLNVGMVKQFFQAFCVHAEPPLNSWIHPYCFIGFIYLNVYLLQSWQQQY